VISDSDSPCLITFDQVFGKIVPYILTMFFWPISEVRTYKQASNQASKQTNYVS
jgi:hypothetical protein